MVATNFSIFERYLLKQLNLAKQKRTFNYKPRFQSNDEASNQADLQTKWQDLKHARKRKSSFLTSPLFLVLFLIAILVLIYILSQYE